MNPYFLLVCLALIFSGCAASPEMRHDESLGNTCYALSPGKRGKASGHLFVMKASQERLQEAWDIKTQSLHLSLVKENLEDAARLGHPTAFMIKCDLGQDTKAPLDVQLDGLAWCVVGIDSIPLLEKKLGRRVVDSVKQAAINPQISRHSMFIRMGLCKP